VNILNPKFQTSNLPLALRRGPTARADRFCRRARPQELDDLALSATSSKVTDSQENSEAISKP
jgi:hypothetical protein